MDLVTFLFVLESTKRLEVDSLGPIPAEFNLVARVIFIRALLSGMHIGVRVDMQQLDLISILDVIPASEVDDLLILGLLFF